MKINAIRFVNQWLMFLRNYNWNTFSLISIEGEWDKVAQDGYFQVFVMGLGIHIHFIGKFWSQFTFGDK